MKYFNNVSNLSELRKQYKELLKVHHPDNGGNVANMQEINAEYDKKDKHDSKATDSDKASFDNMQYDFAEDEKLREMLGKIIGFRYAKNKRAWYWHSDAFRKKSRKSLSMDDIRSYYGSTEVRTEQRVLLQA